ncbi:MAG: metallophosphoesterase [Myxococcales bacterium]|nr:metallophosphoesterase [Myxococcales bacterium]MCB9717300.1 metallophosphoesterase [Myxococcales bacterium]
MAIVLQLTDPHLLEDPLATLRGVPTRRTLVEVLALARARLPRIDRVVLTGDLAHDERPASYLALRQALAPLASRARVLPGNHDDRAALHRVFPADAHGHDPDDPRRCFVDELESWRLVGLDSQIPGKDAGRLGPRQLAWLRAILARAPRPTALFVHHPPVPTGHSVLDTMGLLDADALAAELTRAPWVRLVAHGHIHRATEHRLGVVPVLGTPSTAFQFPARPELGPFEPLPPGCRVLHLDADGWHTEILRLPGLRYPPVPRAS